MCDVRRLAERLVMECASGEDIADRIYDMIARREITPENGAAVLRETDGLLVPVLRGTVH